MKAAIPLRNALFLAALAGLALGLVWERAAAQRGGVPRSASLDSLQSGEFHFARMIYTDRPQNRRYGRGWWSQDWPDAERHFNQGVGRLTLIDIGEAATIDLMSDDLFDYPWLYATQVGYWDLTDGELARLREYLARGGFLFVDDFFDREWDVFQRTMARLYPGRPIIEMEPGSGDEVLNILYDLNERVQIPGLRHLGRGGFRARLPEPHWRGIYDDKGRLVVAVNYNMDIGDAWEHADDPFYPQPMTALSYRFAINYTIYAMTH